MAPVGQTTLLEMVNSAAVLADQPTPSTSTFIPKATWVEWVNAGCQELYDELIEAYGEDYFFATAQTITTDGTNSTFALSDSFYKLLGVDLQLSNNANGWVTIWRYNFASRNQYSLPSLQAMWGRTALKYRIQGYNIAFIPAPPASGQTLRLWYAPRFTPLTADGDTFDGVNGWEEYVKAVAAAKALGKEESDQTPALSLLRRQRLRLQDIKAARDVGAPSTTVDVYRANGNWGAFWPGDSGW